MKERYEKIMCSLVRTAIISFIPLSLYFEMKEQLEEQGIEVPNFLGRAVFISFIVTGIIGVIVWRFA